MSNHKLLKNIAQPRQWYNIIDAADGSTPELYIYDVIGQDWWGDGLSPKDFAADLKELEKTNTKLNLRVNSPGGIVSDGFAVYNAIKQSRLEVTAYVDALAASAASFIIMAADKVHIPPAAEIMIHNVWGFAMGDADEMRRVANMIDSKQSIIINIYAEKTGIDRDELAAMMSEETWMDGAKAVELGFADELIEDAKIAACGFDLDIFANLPAGFVKYQNALKKREKERAMRDAGRSRSAAARCAADADNGKDPDYREKAQNTLIKELQQCLTK